ncbi:MAG: prolipoprotein diacylglyceryl transferase [Desulfobacterales bacterium]|nr:prolipoprotein diacylglyceryl transferase [Desulfobacterales bacterium]
MTDFWTWWQHLPQYISPVIFQIGSFKLQYYGLMYLVAFGITYALVLYRLRHEPRFTVSREQVNDLTTVIILGLMVGARLGYVVFYNLGYFLRHPLEIVLPFEFSDGITFTGISGMSYHGGVIGIIVAAWLYTRKHGLALRDMADLYVPCIPLGYTFGRIGNFINGELYGRVTTAPIGMLFPLAPDKLPRHPSQLYEAFFEGVFLFAVMWSIRKMRAPRGAMLGVYLMGYGLVRFFIEFYREPDAHIGFVVGVFSMGQLLCAAMVAAGGLLVLALKHRADA